MFKEAKQRPTPTRRVFLGCAAGAVGIGAAPVREEPEEVIPLNTVVATTRQEGLLEPPWKLLRGDEELGRLLSRKAVGPSNLFLVVGKDIDVAIKATHSVFFEGFRADWINLGNPRLRPDMPPPEKPKFWAFVHFGATRSTPIEWTVTRVAVQSERVRITVSRPKPPDAASGLAMHATADIRMYMIWVPLGEREQREQKGFTLEAYDETNRAMMMTRRVVVVEF